MKPAARQGAAQLSPERAEISVLSRVGDGSRRTTITAAAGGEGVGREVVAAAGRTCGVKPTQDWTEHHVVFNTLDNAKITLYFGDWGHPKTGSLQWKDWRIEEVGLLNVLRRPGTPVTVRGERWEGVRGGEGLRADQGPAHGERPVRGGVQVWHEPPVIRTGLARRDAAAGVVVPPGDHLRRPGVGAASRAELTMQLLADQASG